VKIQFNGAAQTVTGSQHLLEINGHRVLLDCGLFQGHRKDFYERNQNFDFDPASIECVLLSHAHIDHSGNLPNLVKMGFKGPIYSTPPTAALGEIMLRDSAHIQEADAEYATKKNSRRGEEPVEPLYTTEDAIEACKHYYPVKYDEAFSPIPGLNFASSMRVIYLGLGFDGYCGKREYRKDCGAQVNWNMDMKILKPVSRCSVVFCEGMHLRDNPQQH
jgi:metallo-beta-lactamase family protein